jgi:hypothetical protein
MSDVTSSGPPPCPLCGEPSFRRAVVPAMPPALPAWTILRSEWPDTSFTDPLVAPTDYHDAIYGHAGSWPGYVRYRRDQKNVTARNHRYRETVRPLSLELTEPDARRFIAPPSTTPQQVMRVELLAMWPYLCSRVRAAYNSMRPTRSALSSRSIRWSLCWSPLQLPPLRRAQSRMPTSG